MCAICIDALAVQFVYSFELYFGCLAIYSKGVSASWVLMYGMSVFGGPIGAQKFEGDELCCKDTQNTHTKKKYTHSEF